MRAVKACKADLTAALIWASSSSFTRSVLLIIVKSATAICLKEDIDIKHHLTSEQQGRPPACVCLCVFVCVLRGDSRRQMLSSNGSWQYLAWRWKHKHRTRMQRGHATGLSSSVYLLNNNKHTAAAGNKLRRPGGTGNMSGGPV